MTQPFKIESQDITHLGSVQLTQLLKLLLHAEAGKFGVAQRAVEVALNILVGDGGEDGRIEWTGAPDSTDHIPNRLTLFQNKATTMEPGECANELVTAAGAIKPMVGQVFERGGSYVLFTTQELNTRQKQDRVSRMKQKLVELQLPYAESVEILIYDASSIEGWVNQYVPAIVLVMNCTGRQVERGYKSFLTWKTSPQFTEYPFIDVEARRQAISDLTVLLRQPSACARIIGLSGLGKTRTAFEIFNSDVFLREQVVYVDAAVAQNVAGVLTDWVSHGLTGILVVDNCDHRLHADLQREICRTGSKMKLLTLDYNLERVSDTRVLLLDPLSNPEIKEMLTSMYQDRIPDLDRIVGFAQGFPQMAVLIAKARLNDDPNLGALDDDAIAEKLLWGAQRTVNQQDEKILKGCALFDKFGVDKEASGELRFIATHVVNVSENDFFDCVQRFAERGIIDRRGRYGQLVPKPLAIRLAAEWWKRTQLERQTALIGAIPDSMIVSFCDQIEKLDFLPEVKGLTESICGNTGPFGQAEVILSSRGSRLFRALVNINPSATVSALSNVLHELSYQERLEIAGDVRRNFVWALEKLCFHDDIFEEAAWDLLLLASAENESWSNNAQGIFAQLFRVQLSGTEACPKLRLQLLERAIKLSDPAIDQVAVKALKNAVDTHGGSRMVGAEYQGTAPPLREWSAATWQEIFDYWSVCFDLLIVLIERGGNAGEGAKDVIGRSIRGLTQKGRVNMLDVAIKRVLELTGKYWPTALESINSSLEFDSSAMPQEGVDALNSWLQLLRPDGSNVEETLRIVVVNPPWQHSEDDKENFVDVAAQRAETLAVQFSTDANVLLEHVLLLLSGEQKQTYLFGKTLALKSETIDPLLKQVMLTLSSVENPNSSFAVGLLSGVNHKSVEIWDRYLNDFRSRADLNKFYPDAICSGTIRPDHLDAFLTLIREGKLPSSRAMILCYGGATKHLSVDDIARFCLALSSIDSVGAWAALDIMAMYCHGDADKFSASRTVLKQLVVLAPLNIKVGAGSSAVYQWSTIATALLKTEGVDFSEAICHQMIAATEDELNHNDIWYYFKPLLANVMARHGEILWPLFGKSIVEGSTGTRYWLQQLLQCENSLSNKKVSIFSLLPPALVIDWCKENLDIGPYFVARSIDVFEQKEGEQKTPSLLFISLLENFGNQKDLWGELSANLGTIGWSNSLVPYLQSDRSALLPLVEHSNPNVRAWTREYIAYLDEAIARESMRDDEESL